MGSLEVLEVVLRPAAVVEMADVTAWWRAHRAAGEGLAVAGQGRVAPVDRAIAAAAVAPVPGFAFASGYQEALAALLGDDGGRRRALCATEVGGNHPRAIATTLVREGAGWVLSGEKTFVTLGRFAEELLVIAREGVDADGRPRLALVRVPVERDGVEIVSAPAAPFVPEIPHARVTLRAVAVEDAARLAGDGYARYLKPFRTVEDAHVMAAILAWLGATGRRAGWDEEVLEKLVAVLVAARAVACADATAAVTHVALAGMLRAMRAVVDELEVAGAWAGAAAAAREAWRRDRRILEVASQPRAQRRRRAWEAMAEGRSESG